MKLTRNPLFWIIQVVLLIICSGTALHFYPKAFPSVDLKIKMNRKEALKSASDLAIQNHWGPEPFQQAVSFDVDQETQTFVELSAGGSDAFKQILNGKLYSPYTWKVRHFSPGRTLETYIRYTPGGDFYGFQEFLPEDAPGKALRAEEAQKIAERSAVENWKVDLSAYNLIEKSKEERPSHRIDHTFVYERTQEKIGDGTYRLKLVIGGDQLTELSHFIKIPDAFTRKYAEMRSSNNTIATIATVAMTLLYLILGCGLGIFLLARKHWVLWRTPLVCAFIVALFQVLENINQLPLAWMHYDTAISPKTFLVRNLLYSAMIFLSELALLTLSFMAAESLSRKAFPHHPQLWKIWKKDNAASLEILGRTLGGYLTVGIFFCYVVFVYLFGKTVLGWWNPTDILFHPDGLASYFPWLTSVSNSLHAGFWEESLFRAVPLASAALLGQRWGRRRTWLIFGFIVQALIFAAGHANYPTQPSYARVIELIFPSFLFGGIYLYFGLLPGIILHFTFDVISFSIPLFTASTPGIWYDRILIILLSLIPLWIVLFNRIRLNRWTSLKQTEYNQSWTPTKRKPAPTVTVIHEQPTRLGRILAWIFPLSALILITFWLFLFPPKKYAPTLSITQSQAIEIAQKALSDANIRLTLPWEPLAHLVATEPDEQNRFVWRTEDHSVYLHLVGDYLMPPSWRVRFVRFDVNVEERAEEYQVLLSGKGEVIDIRHELPESRPGRTLDQNEAKMTAFAHIKKVFHIDGNLLREVSSRAFKLPARTDWLFIFTDPSIKLKTGESRIAVQIAGDQISSSRKFIFIPEEWLRNERNRENILGIVKTVCGVFILIVFLSGILAAIISWTRHQFKTRSFFIVFGLFFSLSVFQLANSLSSRLAHFSTEEPRVHQLISVISFGLLKALMLAIVGGLYVGYLHYRSKPTRYSLSISLPIGYATGIISTVTLGLILHFFPQLSPPWGSLDSFDSTFPVLYPLFKIPEIVLFALIQIWIIQITNWLTTNWTRRRWLGFIFLLLNGFASFGLASESLQTWLVMGALSGLLFYFLYRFLIRSAISLIPLIAVAPTLISSLKQMKLQPYSGVLTVSLLTLILAVALSALWHQRLNDE